MTVPLCDAFGKIHLREVDHYLWKRKLNHCGVGVTLTAAGHKMLASRNIELKSIQKAHATQIVTHHANVFPLPGVEHLVVFHSHVQLPGSHLLQRHVKLKPSAQEAEADGQETAAGTRGLEHCDCGMKPVVSLVIEDGVDRPLLHVGLLPVPPGLVGQQVQADVRVCAIFVAREQVPASGKAKMTRRTSEVEVSPPGWSQQSFTPRTNRQSSPAGINKDNELFPQGGVTDCQMDLPE